MIRVTVELISAVDESRSRKLAVLDIANDGTGDALTGNYEATLYAEYTGKAGRKGKVTGFKRQNQSVMSLVGAFLKLFGHTRHSPKLMQKL